jgi:hypothetical protein
VCVYIYIYRHTHTHIRADSLFTYTKGLLLHEGAVSSISIAHQQHTFQLKLMSGLSLYLVNLRFRQPGAPAYFFCNSKD